MTKRLALAASALLTVCALLWLLADSSGRAPTAVGTVDGRPADSPALRGPDAPVEPALERELEPQREPAPSAAPAEPRPERSSMRVLVVNAPDEQPIEGARITVFAEDGTSTATSGPDGRCALELAPSGESVRLRVEREGWFHASANYQRLEELTIRLSRVTTLFGRMVAADSGAAVPGAKVTFGHGWCKGCEPDVVVAGDDGSYEFPGLPLRFPIWLGLEAPGFPAQGRNFELRSDEARVEVELRLERGLEIAGRVVDFQTGAGIPAATVGALVADAAGRFRGRILPAAGAGKIDLIVGAMGHCTLYCTYDLADPANQPEFRLPRGTVVEGIVRDEAGQPIPGAVVRVDTDYTAEVKAKSGARAAGVRVEPSPLDELGCRIEPEGYGSEGRTDEQGRFRITNAVPWAAFQAVEAFAEGYDSAQRLVERLGGPGETTRVELALARAAQAVHVSGALWLNGSSFRTAEGRVTWKGPSKSGEAMIDAGGFYLGAERGRVAFRVEVDGFTAPLEGAEFELELARDDTEHRVELRSPTRPILGRVTFADGEPVPKASISASCPLSGGGGNYWDRLHVSTKSAEDGTYVLEVPELGSTYRVEAERDRAECAREGVSPGAAGVDIVLPRSGALLFRLVDATSRAELDATDFELGWRHAGEQEFHSVHIGWPLAADPEGWYELRLPVGRIDLSACQDHQGDDYRSVLVESVLINVLNHDEPRRVEFEMTRGLVVELRLAADAPALPADHTVLLIESELYDEVRQPWDGGRLGSRIRKRHVRFDEQRTATIRGLAPGAHRFKVFPDDLLIEPAEVLVVQGGEVVQVRWRSR